MTESEVGDSARREAADVWRVVGMVLLAACVLSLIGGVAQELRFTSSPFHHSTHLRIQAAARAVGLVSAGLLLAAVLAMASVRRWSRRDRFAYRFAGALGGLIAVVALYSAVDVANSIAGQPGVPAFDRLGRGTYGVATALVGATVVWLVFRSRRSKRHSVSDAP